MGRPCLLLFLGSLSVWFMLVGGKALSLKSRIQCCNSGTNHSASGQECKNFRPLTLGVEAGEETACRVLADVCCKNHFKLHQCDIGKKDAREGSCSSEEGERKECCSACFVGIEIGNAGELCIDSIGLSPPYDNVFITCCQETKTTPSTPSSTTKATSFTAEIQKYSKANNIDGNTNERLPGLSEENICETSEYCAQLCKTAEKGAYECACFDGYVLMEDGVSCKPVKRSLNAGGRCEINNPCDHDCLDTGTQIKCLCRDGYELGVDKKSCKDVDECALNLHDCGATEECVNEEGTYDCYDPTLSSSEYDGPQCPIGYKFNSKKLACDDINECEFGIVCAPPKICKNTIGSFVCEGEDRPACPPGFYYKSAIATCADIDECVTGDNNCNKESQVCLNTKGNYTCVDKASKHTCPPGFKKNIITGVCEDIDECIEDDSACPPNEKCVNEEGGHTCIPEDGRPMGNDIVQPPVEILTTTPKPVTCPRGFKFVRERNACDDINECTETSEACDSSSTCVNTPGSYICQCKTGFQNDPITGACEDINECVMGSNICGEGQRCDNTIGSYLCTRIYGCGTGYTLNHANGLCVDDDECRFGTHNCDRLGPNFKCRNLLGSYRCDYVRPAPPPTQRTTQRTTPTTSTTTSTTTTSTTTEAPRRRQPDYYPSYETTPRQYQPPHYPTPVPRPTPPRVAPSPPPSYTSYTSSTQRTYPDTPPIPLYQNTTPIDYYSSTTPTPSRPSYYPYPYPGQNAIIGQRKLCLPGYVMNSRGDCEDIDECRSNPCPRNRKCVNYNGRFECVSAMVCKRGYELNDGGDQCVDVNECARGIHKCHFSQICKNGEGYYTCECPPGHHLSRSSICEDLDECRVYRPCGNNAECINTKGSYQCNCMEGFKKTDNSCRDIDECAETPGLCEHTCVNIWGSHRCACKRGFRLNPSDNRTCIDIDECEQHKNDRLCIGNCQNVPGSYRCVCPPGYRLGSDSRICLDIDECESNVCGYDNVCLNTRGSHKCFPINCPQNYEKDHDHKARCKRTCDPRDNWCLVQPDQYTYQFVSLASDLPVNGKVQLFQIKGPQWTHTVAEFSMKVLEARAPGGVERVSDHFFQKVNQDVNSMSIFLVRSIKGPQEVKLQVEMKLFDGGRLMGSTVIYIIIDVSQYTF